ncbi:hypothetical protein M569_16759 [Genlisea aurea]|uniref:Uncharacterized protein n=1 Tax=Genlisea aurea TaxID=192259 RepID=S8C0T2_9LAMI|nr:hypothetical protein M569_16759 [Genlisea aurea]
MNSLNPTAVKGIGYRRGVFPSNRPFCSKPLSSLCFRFSPPPRSLQLSAKASLGDSSHETANRRRNGSELHVSERPVSYSPISASLKAIAVTAVAGAAIFFSGFGLSLNPPPALANSSPPTAERAEEDSVMVEETEKFLEDQFHSDQCDLEGLKMLMEIKIKNKKIPEAIQVIDKLIELQPDDSEWPMLKFHLHSYNEDFELAKNGFAQLLQKDPARVEAYHGLVTVAAQQDSVEELTILEEKIHEAIKLCKRDNKRDDARDFKLLLAQIKVVQSRYEDALKQYEELVKEEPRDFRPYLCQGIIYTLLKKNNEAEKNFDKYRRLIPKGHPYANYFNDNMVATKLFAQKIENERAMAKS